MTNTVTLPLASYEPDKPDFPADGSANIMNAYPKVGWNGGFSYGPVKFPEANYGPLNARCQGGVGYHTSDAAVFIFAGDDKNLYLLEGGLDTWQNASKALDAYGIDSEEQWQFTYFNNEVIAVNFNDQPQIFTLVGGSIFGDIADAPRGHYVAVVKNAFVVLANTWDSTNEHMPQRVWWSGAGNARSWPLPGTNEAAQVQSGATDLLGSGGDITGIASNLIYADAVIFQEFAVRRMQYAGPPDVFTFLPIENAKGCVAPYSIVVNGGVVYYWGQDGIYSFDGGTSTPIGTNRVDRTIFAGFSQFKFKRVVGIADPFLKLIWWAFPSINSPDGNCDRLLIYNYQLDKFSIAEVTSETLIRFLSIGYTLDQLYTIFGYTVDTIPYPLSSSFWLGGVPQWATFGADHRLHLLSGPNLGATIETSEVQAIPGRRALITGVRPLVDSTAAAAAIGHRESLQEDVTYASGYIVNKLGMCPQRASGRYIRVSTLMPAGIDWNDFSGVEVEVVNQGKR